MNGLTSAQVSNFLTQYGLNTITEQKKKSIFVKFFEQFGNNILTYGLWEKSSAPGEC